MKSSDEGGERAWSRGPLLKGPPVVEEEESKDVKYLSWGMGSEHLEKGGRIAEQDRVYI